jgi:hypothetical protein
MISYAVPEWYRDCSDSNTDPVCDCWEFQFAIADATNVRIRGVVGGFRGGADFGTSSTHPPFLWTFSGMVMQR